MKKVFALTALTLVIVMAFAAPAMAAKPAAATKAQKVSWFECGPGNSDDPSGAQIPGHVNFNTPSGAVSMIVNGVITLEPNATYAVFIRDLSGFSGTALWVGGGWREMAYFTTDEFGYGEFHFNFASAELAAGPKSIQVALNPIAEEFTHTVAATQLWTYLQTK